jgi:hypothetical protein
VSAHSGALEAVERVLNRGGEAEDVLTAVAAILGSRLGREVRVSADGFEVAGELDDDGLALVERVTLLASPYL